MTPSKIVGAGGIAAIVAAISYVFSLLSNPDFLADLLVAIQTHQDPTDAIVKLFAALIGVVGAITVTCTGFWLAHSPLATFSITETRTTTGTLPAAVVVAEPSEPVPKVPAVPPPA